MKFNELYEDCNCDVFIESDISTMILIMNVIRRLPEERQQKILEYLLIRLEK